MLPYAMQDLRPIRILVFPIGQFWYEDIYLV